jgi:hypothetical protein
MMIKACLSLIEFLVRHIRQELIIEAFINFVSFLRTLKRASNASDPKNHRLALLKQPSMLIQTLVVTLLPAIALAVPATQTTSNSGEDAYGIPSSVIETIFNVPASIESAYIQAIPTAWIASLADTAFASSGLAEEEAGIEPSWYRNEPDSEKEYFSTRNETIDSYYASASSSYCAKATIWTTDVSGTAFPLCTAGSNADSSPGSTITSTPASGSASTSSTQLGSMSTGGVPDATTGIAMSLAGTMVLLGLAIAL